MTIGERIKKRRMELKWSQRELSDRMGYSNHSTITKIEAGKVDIPQSKIVKFAEVLNVSVAYLMNWEEEIKRNDIQADIVLRMRSDEKFMEAVSYMYNLDDEKLESVKQLLITFQK